MKHYDHLPVEHFTVILLSGTIKIVKFATLINNCIDTKIGGCTSVCAEPGP